MCLEAPECGQLERAAAVKQEESGTPPPRCLAETARAARNAETAFQFVTVYFAWNKESADKYNTVGIIGLSLAIVAAGLLHDPLLAGAILVFAGRMLALGKRHAVSAAYAVRLFAERTGENARISGEMPGNGIKPSG